MALRHVAHLPQCFAETIVARFSFPRNTIFILFQLCFCTIIALFWCYFTKEVVNRVPESSRVDSENPNHER
nr:MAG TPA: hypothetical protein [Caudoviricetes sp.]